MIDDRWNRVARIPAFEMLNGQKERRPGLRLVHGWRKTTNDGGKRQPHNKAKARRTHQMSLPTISLPHHSTPPPSSALNAYDASQTQLTEIPTQPFTQNEDSCLSPLEPNSPPPNQPRWWGKLIPCSSESSVSPIQLFPKPGDTTTGDSYTIGRSIKCEIQVERFVRDGDSDHQKKRAEWAYGLISNRHCSITCTPTDCKIQDCSGNGTAVNDSVLRKGEEMSLSSGDAICLLNPMIVKRKIRGPELQALLQEYSFLFVPNNLHLSTRKPVSAVRVRSLTPSTGQRPRLYPSTAPSKELSIAADYELGDVLGTGTVGEVRRAVHKRTGKAVAVKILGRSQLAAEASILRRLSHPYIVRLIDVHYETHTVYLVMELMEKDLFSCIVEKERYSECQARFIMRRLLAALHYLHEEAQVVHRDLKPENILLRGDKEIKLTDFGLAKQDSDGGLQTFCGTPQYFAPEVLNRAHTVLGRGRYGKPADLWSLGIVLYVMLTGCTPQFDLGSAMVWDEADRLLTDTVKDLIARLLDPNPTSRLTVTQCCDHPWVLRKDAGDTHQHPLDDPALNPSSNSPSQASPNKKVPSRTMDVDQKLEFCKGDVLKSPTKPTKISGNKQEDQRLPLSPLNSSRKTAAFLSETTSSRGSRLSVSTAEKELASISPLATTASLRRVSESADKHKMATPKRKCPTVIVDQKRSKITEEPKNHTVTNNI